MKREGKFIGLVGLGYWGKNILRNLIELEGLHTACDSNPQVISRFKKDFPHLNFTNSFKNTLLNPAIKAVVISTPAVTHYECVKSALLAGKDVYVEKPLALTVKEGEELVSLARRQKKILMVGHILQYHPALLKIKEHVLQKKLGRIQYIYSNRLNIGKLRTEENILWSFAPHDISIILMLLNNEMPLKVSAFAGDYLNKNIYDTTLTTLEFKNKVKGHIFVSWLHPYKEQKLIIVGSKGMLVFDDVSEEKLFLYPHKIKWVNGKIPIAQKADYQVIPVKKEEPLKLALAHFIECVQKRKKPLTDGAEGLRVLKVLESAEKSLLRHSLVSPAKIFVHESARIDENVSIGQGTKVWHFSHILRDSKIGKDCIIGQSVMIGPDVQIGNGCKIQNNVSIYKGVTIEDDVFCGPSCVFTNVYNPRAFIERKKAFLKTLVKKGATIGANVTIVCGVNLGRYSMIGAGAVVKEDVSDYAVVVGVPAKQIGWACKCGLTLKFRNKDKVAICSDCHNEYRIKGKQLIALKEN